MNKRARAHLELQNSESDAARDAGRVFFKGAPELMLMQVYREANARYQGPQRKHEHDAFVAGYANARRQHEEFNQEKAL